MKKILLSLVLSLSLISQGYCVDNWTPASPASTDLAADIGTLVQVNNNALNRLLPNYVMGCKLSYASTITLTVSAGSVACSNTAETIRKLRTNTSATTVALTDIDTGSAAASNTYYVYAIGDGDTTTFTVVISLNSVTPGGTSHDYYKKLGSFYLDSSSYITNIVNTNNQLSTYDSGWFAVSSGSTYTKTHNLGTKDVLILIYSASDSSGTGMQLEGWSTYIASVVYGIMAYSFTTTQITIATGGGGFNYVPGVDSPITSGYARIVMITIN